VEIREGISSVLGKAEQDSEYDEDICSYDAVVGNRFYNKIV